MRVIICLITGAYCTNSVIGDPDQYEASSEGLLSQCSEADRDLWRGNMQFSLDLSNIAFKGLGMESRIGPALKSAYPTLSEPCMTCFTAAAACGRDNCTFDCILGRLSRKCLDCNAKYCNPSTRACVGALTDWDMPPVPTPDDGASITTLAPQRHRKRKPVRPIEVPEEDREEGKPPREMGRKARIAAGVMMVGALITWILPQLFR